MPNRREMLRMTAKLGAILARPFRPLLGRISQPDGVEVNDVQSQLNATRVHRIIRPRSIDEIQAALRDARKEGRAVSLAGGRHAMGGQQFGRDTFLLDMKAFNRVVSFDRVKGQITVEGGIEWPELVEHLNSEQAGQPHPWAIREKQSGVDRVSLGG